MKLREEFITYDAEEFSMLVPTGAAGFAGLVRGNRTLGEILTLLREETTAPEIAQKLSERFDAPADVIEKDVLRVTGALREIGAIDE